MNMWTCNVPVNKESHLFQSTDVKVFTFKAPLEGVNVPTGVSCLV